MIGIKLLLVLVLLLLPFGELFRVNIGNDIYIKPLDITACLITVLYIGWLCLQKRKPPKYIAPVLGFPLIGLISLALNSYWLAPNELITASLYLVRWIAYAGVLFAVLSVDAAFKKKILHLLLLDGIIVVVFGYIQYFFYSDIRQLLYLGWDDHMYRLFSTFYDPNFAGAFLTLFLFFITGLFFGTNMTNKQKVFVGLLIAVTIIAILLTYSRSALLMLIVGGVTLLVLLGKKRLIVGLVSILILFIFIASPLFYIENTNLFRAASTGARLETYQNALTLYQDKPILGVGFNAYRYAQQEYGFRDEKPLHPSNADSGVDNSFLFVLATTGIVGFAAYLFMWKRLLGSAFIHLRQKQNWIAKVFIASAAGIGINAFFINSLFFSAILLWMWVLFGSMHTEE